MHELARKPGAPLTGFHCIVVSPLGRDHRKSALVCSWQYCSRLETQFRCCFLVLSATWKSPCTFLGQFSNPRLFSARLSSPSFPVYGTPVVFFSGRVSYLNPLVVGAMSTLDLCVRPVFRLRSPTYLDGPKLSCSHAVKSLEFSWTVISPTYRSAGACA